MIKHTRTRPCPPRSFLCNLPVRLQAFPCPSPYWCQCEVMDCWPQRMDCCPFVPWKQLLHRSVLCQERASAPYEDQRTNGSHGYKQGKQNEKQY